MKNISRKLGKISTQYFASLNQVISGIASTGVDVIRLDIGSPDIPPANHIIQALVRAANEPNHHGYIPHRGTDELRKAWSGMYQTLYGVHLDPDHQILPLIGSKEGIFHLMQLLIDPGDYVLIPDPGYLTYEKATQFAGGELYRMPLLPERDFLPDFKVIPSKIARRAKIMWLNYPNNPTSSVASLEFFSEAINFANKYDILICQDAAYSRITFDNYFAPSILQICGATDFVLEFNSLSKSYNMAGWRVGAVVGNSMLIENLHALKTQIDSGHFFPILEAATTALNGDQNWLLERNNIYQERRDITIECLRKIGLVSEVPKASLYIWFQVPLGITSDNFAKTVLEKAHVSLTPGTVFGNYGEGYIRLSLTTPKDRLIEAMERISRIM